MAAGSTSSVPPVSATARVAATLPTSRDTSALVPGSVLRLAPGGSAATGWTLESLGGGQVLTLLQPPLGDLAAGDELLLRVVSVWPRLALELVERRAAGSAPISAASAAEAGATQARLTSDGGKRPDNATPNTPRADSGWSQLSALRADVADWRRLALADAGVPSRSVNAAQLIQAWTDALAQGRPPIGPGGEPFWLLPQPYWLRRERDTDQAHGEATSTSTDEEPALSLLMKWRGAAIGIQLQGPRHAVRLTLLAESDRVLTALRGEVPRLVAALMRAGARLHRLGWRQQALWVPVDPFPHLRADPSLLSAAAELLTELTRP